MRILLVEDRPTTACVLRELLGRAGHEVEGAADAAEGAALARRGGWGAVVVDWMLADGDGLAVLRDMRARGDGTPVVMTTAAGDADLPDLQREAAAMGAPVLRKPFEPEELLALLGAGEAVAG